MIGQRKPRDGQITENAKNKKMIHSILEHFKGHEHCFLKKRNIIMLDVVQTLKKKKKTRRKIIHD